MFSLWLCYLGNPASLYSRKAYASWKKKSHLLLQNMSNNAAAKRRYCEIRCRKTSTCFKKLKIPNRVLATFYKFERICVNCSCANQSQLNVLLQMRWINDEQGASKLKKTKNFLVTLLPHKLLKMLETRVNVKTSKPVINCLTINANPTGNLLEHQQVLDFPNFFSKDAAFNSATNILRSKSNIPTLKEKSNEFQSSANAISFSNTPRIEHNSVSTQRSPQNDNSLQSAKLEKINSDAELCIKSSAIVQRSQYENLTPALSSKKVTELKDEKSVFSSLWTYVEIPVNSFFSFISRANVEKEDSLSTSTGSSNGNDDSLQHQVSQAGEELEQEQQQIPQTRSMLEMLYQYIPYVRSSSDTEYEDHSGGMKLDDAIRLKAEKELLLQKVNINNRTRYLLQAISYSNSLFNLTQYVDELKDHLLRFPDTRITAVKENGIKEIMRIYRTTHDSELLPSIRMVLAMLGAVDPPKMKGVRILAIDGGGSRGLASVEICRRLVEVSGRPINELFDYVCGVSTGAILGFALGVMKMPLDDLAVLYRDLSCQIFNQSKIAGTGGLVFSHAYYSTENYQRKMKEIFGNKLLIETAAMEDVPKCSAVSTLVNRLPLKPFMWRNYSIVPGTRDTHWNGTCRGTMWEAVRASSAAPGYFEEYKKQYNIHQDGGVLTNNPTGVALNECRLLWPNDPIQCVVSIGTGRYEPVVGPVGEDFSSLKDKIMKFVDSATNVTEIHNVMYDLLPSGSYFRFNPYMDEPLLLDECRTEKMDLLVKNTLDYIEANDFKFKACANTLLDKRVYKNNF